MLFKSALTDQRTGCGLSYDLIRADPRAAEQTSDHSNSKSAPEAALPMKRLPVDDRATSANLRAQAFAVRERLE